MLSWLSKGHTYILSRSKDINMFLKGLYNKSRLIHAYKMWSKSIKTEAIFTKTEKNNEWNIKFLWNTRCDEKVSKTEAVFIKIEINNEWNSNFLLNMRCVKKNIKDWIWIYQIKHGQWNSFFRIVALTFNTYSCKYFTGWSTPEISPLTESEALSLYFFFISSKTSNLTIDRNFQFRK